MDTRLITSDKLKEDSFESAIRPQMLDEYIGQKDIKENIRIFKNKGCNYNCRYKKRRYNGNCNSIC